MKEIFLPKSETETGGETPRTWEKFIIPDSMSQKEELKLYPDFINALSKEIKNLQSELADTKKEIKSFDDKLREQSNKNIEIIGIFSAILALLIVDVSIIKSAESFLSAILLITALTCSIAIFAILIHLFFSPPCKVKFGKYFWIPFGILSILIIVGIVTHVFWKIDLYDLDKEKSNIETGDSVLPNPTNSN